MTLTQTTGRALVQLVAAMRRDWQPAGIETAIRKAAEDGANGHDICIAAVRVAADPAARTPGLIPQPGPHWQGLAAGKRHVPLPCPVHPDQPVRCTTCTTEAVPPPTNWRNRK